MLIVGRGCSGGNGPKLLNVGGGGSGGGGSKLLNIGGSAGRDNPPLLLSPLLLLKFSLEFFNLFSLFCMAWSIPGGRGDYFNQFTRYVFFFLHQVL